MDISSLLTKSCLMYRDNVAVTFAGRSQTYAELGDRAGRLANALSDLGLEPGDRVAVLGDNNLEFIEQAAGIAVAGMVRSPMYVMNPPPTHAYMLNMIGASACIVQDRYAAELESVRDQVPSLKHVIVMGGQAGGSDRLEYEAVLAAASPQFPDVAVAPDADHIIRFSAGTTGKPKGIVHSLAGWLAMGNELALMIPRLMETDAYLVASPMSHAAGLMIWPILVRGARYVIMSSFDPAQFVETIERERVTMTMLVPTMVGMLAAVPDVRSRDLSSLRVVSYGAAPITESQLRTAIDLWGNVMYQTFGQSEALPATTLAPEYHNTSGSQRDQRILTSAGRPNPNVSITIRDEDDNLLPLGEVGEICVNTPGAMKGIWGDPEATASRFTSDGSVRTRDMGYLDEDGFLHLVDRKEDLIISGGFNVWPLEVENAIAAHPAVREVAVVGVPDEKWGEAVFAVVMLTEGSTATEEELIAFAREKVGPVKRPKQIVISDHPLPKSPVGKLLRRQAREEFWTPPDGGADQG
jgi:acyl-CoA synthetase (AMP-forming)/AMP-acid ligase II